MLTSVSSDAVWYFLCTKLNNRDCSEYKIQFPNAKWELIISQRILVAMSDQATIFQPFFIIIIS